MIWKKEMGIKELFAFLKEEEVANEKNGCRRSKFLWKIRKEGALRQKGRSLIRDKQLKKIVNCF